MKKIYDLAVVVGQYEKNGETKKKYLNIGGEFENGEGNNFIIMDRTFNSAGLPNSENRSTFIISKFKPKEEGGKNAPEPSAPSNGDIPF